MKKGPFNAKTPRRQDAKIEETLCVFATLRLCVKNSAAIRDKILAKM